MKEQELTKQELSQQLAGFSPAEKKAIREYLQRKNPLLFRKFERIKHELLRLEAKRAQLEIEHQEQEMTLLDEKIFAKKVLFLQLLLMVRKKRG